MANKERGEVLLKIADQDYILRFTINSICELEDELGQGIQEIIQSLEDPDKLRIKPLRALFWAGLLDKQPQTTIRAAGDILTGVGTAEVFEAVSAALAAAFPDNKKNKPDKNPKREAAQSAGATS